MERKMQLVHSKQMNTACAKEEGIGAPVQPLSPSILSLGFSNFVVLVTICQQGNRGAHCTPLPHNIPTPFSNLHH